MPAIRNLPLLALAFALLFASHLPALSRPRGVDPLAYFHKKGHVWVLDKNNIRRVWYKSGQAKAKGPYRQGRREGQWLFFYSNGNKKAEGAFLAGKQSGPWILYAKNGRIASKGSYQNGRREGPWKFYYANGRLKLEGSYNRGLREGLWSHYYESGRLFYRGSYLHNQPNGKWTYYFAGGELNQSGTFQHGIRIGAWRVCVQPKGPCGTERYYHSKVPQRSQLKRSLPKSKLSTKDPAKLLDSLDGGGVPDKTPKGLKGSW